MSALGPRPVGCIIAFICGGEGCETPRWEASFEAERETWGDMLAAIRGGGWWLNTDEQARVVDARCPACLGAIGGAS